jgi:hypothetical protein
MEYTIDAEASIEERLTFLKGLSVYELASIAECGQPDSAASPGADLIMNAQLGLIDWLQFPDDEVVPVAELADAAVTPYTHPLWLQFVDLCGYDEELATEMALGSTMTQQAQYVLCSIAERFLYNICEILHVTTDRD